MEVNELRMKLHSAKDISKGLEYCIRQNVDVYFN